MADSPLAKLDEFRGSQAPANYPPNIRRLYSPVDKVQDALACMLRLADQSIAVAMFGFDDPVLAGILDGKLRSPHCYVQLTLDSTQGGGVHERALLAAENYPANSIAIGRSERGDIMHLKQIVIDGYYTICGSTNWSIRAETKQDNEITIIADHVIAAEARARMDCIHANILAKQHHDSKRIEPQ
jgi:phosphatidylserine/phosphatidylglycerophosphate/cardiolipin synthase-like enzyme